MNDGPTSTRILAKYLITGYRSILQILEEVSQLQTVAFSYQELTGLEVEDIGQGANLRMDQQDSGAMEHWNPEQLKPKDLECRFLQTGGVFRPRPV